MRSPSKRIRVAESELNLPPGFRFHPTDEELIVHYLCHKSQTKLDTCSVTQPPSIIGDIDLYKHEPWELPEMALFGTKEWYFFTPRDRKYPNGSRPNRVTGNGYWKATGADKPIKSKSDPNITVGIKKALVFYAGKGNKGIKMNWIMHEYRLNYIPSKNSSISKLDDWVLCRLYNKKNNPNEMIILQDNNVVNSGDNLHPTSPPLEESQRGNSYSNNNGDSFDSFEYSDEGEFSGNFQGDAIFSAYLPLESLSKDKDTSEQNIMGQTESLMEKKEHENDWFDSLSLEDLHHCLEAMPTSNLDFYEMPIYDF